MAIFGLYTNWKQLGRINTKMHLGYNDIEAKFLMKYFDEQSKISLYVINKYFLATINPYETLRRFADYSLDKLWHHK